jgi:CheY-like chemotaxis protein
VSRGKLILAEDEPIIAFMLEDLVEELGYTIEATATSLGEVLKLADAPSDACAAILDVDLGGQQVYPAAINFVARGIPVILVTGYAQPPYCPVSLLSVPIVTKPYKPNAIDSAIRQAIAKSELAITR